MAWRQDALPLLTDAGAPEAHGVRVAFSKRLGGVSAAPFDSLNLSPFLQDDPGAVAENHRLFCGAAAMASLKLVRQVHGDVVIETSVAPSGEGICVLGEGDAVLARPGEVSAAAVLAADCVPVLLAGSGGIAAVHAGWRGLVGGVIERALGAIGDVAAAWVGPSIRGCCYEVGTEVIQAFRDAGLPGSGERSVDPGAAAVAILRRSGVGDVQAARDCTSCDPTLFSFRRDGVTGRQAAAISWA